MTVSLRLPEQPGRSLARFRGRIEMEVEGRRRDPIEVALPGPGNDAPARLETDRMRLVVHDLTRMPGGRQWLLDLTIQPRDWPDQLGGRLILRGRRGFVTPSLGRMLEGVEFADTAGHPIQPIGARTMMVAPSGIRVVLDLPSSDVGLPPARLLYRDSLRETIELEFSLEPIPFVRD